MRGFSQEVAQRSSPFGVAVGGEAYGLRYAFPEQRFVVVFGVLRHEFEDGAAGDDDEFLFHSGDGDVYAVKVEQEVAFYAHVVGVAHS